MTDFGVQGEQTSWYGPAEVQDLAFYVNTILSQPPEINAVALEELGHQSCIFLRDVGTDIDESIFFSSELSENSTDAQAPNARVFAGGSGNLEA